MELIVQRAGEHLAVVEVWDGGTGAVAGGSQVAVATHRGLSL
jgi:hypothetical protein